MSLNKIFLFIFLILFSCFFVSAYSTTSLGNVNILGTLNVTSDKICNPITFSCYSLEDLNTTTAGGGGVNYWGSDGINIWNLTARVGIGTAFPYHDMVVFREDGSTPIISIDRSGVATMHLGVSSDGVSVIAANGVGDGTGIIAFRTGVTYNDDITATGTEAMRITEAGRVGIGVSSPTERLEVAGNVSLFNHGISGIVIGNHTSLTSFLDGEEGIQMWYDTSDGSFNMKNVKVGDSYNQFNFLGENFTFQAGAVTPATSLFINSTDTISVGSLSVGSTTAHSWNQFGTGRKDNANVADVNDVYISDDLEVDGTAFIPATGGTAGAYWTVGDVAENMLTIEGRNNLLCKNNSKYCTGEPYKHNELDFGDVACIDPRYGQVIMKCKNSKTDIPVGVVSSTAKMIIGGDADYETGYPVGVAGFVPAKVSNENGGIYPGDLLVLSETKEGYAMKQMGIKNYSGMIIGSAYDFCDGKHEECKIPVLIALSYTKDFQEEINILKEQYKRFNGFFEKIDKICNKSPELCE